MNKQVTIDADYFAELYEAWKSCQGEAKGIIIDRLDERDELRKERDELKAKLATSQNYEDVIAAKDREIESVKKERNRLNAKVNELNAKLDGDATANGLSPATMKLIETEKRLAEADRCIEDCWGHISCGTTEIITSSLGAIEDIIRTYHKTKGDNQ